MSSIVWGKRPRQSPQRVFTTIGLDDGPTTTVRTRCFESQEIQWRFGGPLRRMGVLLLVVVCLIDCLADSGSPPHLGATQGRLTRFLLTPSA
eukprot:4901795-Pyramimonas_sp.AAC.1